MRSASFPYRHPPAWLLVLGFLGSFVIGHGLLAAVFIGGAMAAHHPHRVLIAVLALGLLGAACRHALRLAPRPCTKAGWTQQVGAAGYSVVGPGRAEVSRRGVRIAVTLLASGNTLVEARLPTGFCAVHKDHAHRLAERLQATGNVFVDGLCVFGGDRDRVEALVDEEGRLGLLLAVVHGWPGSTIHSGGIRLRAPYPIVHDLDRAVDEVVALAHALR